MSYRIAVIKWEPSSGSISEMIGKELERLGHTPIYFLHKSSVPKDVDVLITYAPYGRWSPILKQISNINPQNRPIFVHWFTQNPPDLRIPWFFMYTIGSIRAYIDRLNDSKAESWGRKLVNTPPFSLINSKLIKFRYVGECHYANRKNLLDIYAESSQIYTTLHNNHGLPTNFVPWGTTQSWSENLSMERDIDVLWMGKRRTKRRSGLLDKVRRGLLEHGVEMYVADDVEKPFVFGDRRTEFLNRAKITLNLLPTWDDNAFTYRFHLAAGNRSLVVTEHLLPHYPIVEAGKHYVSSPPEKLVDTIMYYLRNEKERDEITENAHKLVTTKLTFNNSVKTVMGMVDKVAT